MPYLVETRRAQRRLHAVDDAHPRRHQVPRRHAARRRRREVQHRRRAEHSPLTGAAVRPIDHVDGLGPGRHGHSPRAPWVALPPYFVDYGRARSCSRRSGWAAWRTCRSAPEGSPVYDATLAATPADRRRRAAGRPRRLQVRVVHARATATRSRPCATLTTGGARTASPARTCPYLDEIEFVVAVDEDSRSNSVRSGDFDIMMTSMGDTIKPVPRRRRTSRSTRRRTFGDTGYIMLNVADR